jgi:hypothetical protein
MESQSPNQLTEKSLPLLLEWILSSSSASSCKGGVEYLSIVNNSITQLEVLLDFLAQLRKKVIVKGKEEGRSRLTVNAKQSALETTPPTPFT